MSVRADIRRFLDDPAAFAMNATDGPIWLQGLDGFAAPTLAQFGDHALRPAQEGAWRGLASLRAGLILGPPGTGKTHLLSWLILGYAHARRESGLPTRIFVSAFTRNAIGNLLDAVASKAARYWPGGPTIHYFGRAPEAGLSNLIAHRPYVGGQGANDALTDLQSDCVVAGGSVWSLYNLLRSNAAPRADGLTAELFDMVCLDEASQIVLGHGLMNLGGLKPGGRLVVAGDDKQLPPVRAERDIGLNGKQFGGSLYTFLKSAGVQEFALDETFRLNAPLVRFPQERFYPGQYSSAAPDRRLRLRDDWDEGLTDWERAALNPDYPITVFMHDGPPAATENAFEAALAARFAELLAQRKLGARADDGTLAADFWSDQVAIVTPHVAQKSAIRSRLAPGIRTGAFIESVDRIQGKEREAIILSYCVGDPEFAVAEGDFIFSSERLNVAITRAKTKLIVLISRRLLEAAPPDQDVMDRAEILREFVYSGAALGETEIRAPDGGRIAVELRAVAFEGEAVLPDIVPPPPDPLAPVEVMTADLEIVLDALRKEVVLSQYRDAALNKVRVRLARTDDVFPDVRRLHALGRASLKHRGVFHGKDFWVASEVAPPRPVYRPDLVSVRARLEEVIQASRRGPFAPKYEAVRDQFLWMDEQGRDVLRPLVNTLVEEGLARWGRWRDAETIDWVADVADIGAVTPPAESVELPEADFVLLNALESIEAKRINFGIVEAWTSVGALATALQWSRERVVGCLDRLTVDGWVLIASEGRIRSRMAELAREVRYVKQRFRRNDAASRPYLVRNLKLELRDRDKPSRNVGLREFLGRQKAKQQGWVEGVRALEALEQALVGLWSDDAGIAGFQARAFDSLFGAWRGDGVQSFAIAADTGSGKTEAACLPLIAAAAADALSGVRGVRAIMAYPRVRLAANQAQRLANYLAALAKVEGAPTLTLGMQSAQVPRSLQTLSSGDAENGWVDMGGESVSFPLFGCPGCGADLLIKRDKGVEGADQLSCSVCDWSFSGWIGSKTKLADNPPHLFLPTMDSLHQWLHNPSYGRLFGDDDAFEPPRALLADEIHLYARLHGAQVGFALRRLMARAKLNAPSSTPMLAIGMSATLGDPAGAWSKLVARSETHLIAPVAEEKVVNPRGREYFYFVQPEIESRGKDVAGASSTIQAAMCLAHGMRRRTGDSGGYRGLVFLDSIDKVRRLHSDYLDAEVGQRLANYRTKLYSDDPVTGAARDTCCREPYGCDRFRDGECWYFAANDDHQWGPRGVRQPGQPLQVASQPVTAAAKGRVEALIKGSDIVFATSALEVGYDDPDINLVYQHYAPVNLASFVQRKGRGGRGSNDRPITGVTLSLYSPRDSRWFRAPAEMVSPKHLENPLNAENYFVRRGQIVSAALDAFARLDRSGGQVWNHDGVPSANALAAAERLINSIFGAEPWRDYPDCGSLLEFWRQAARGSGGAPLWQVREAIAWAPNFLTDQASASVTVVAGDGGGADVNAVREAVGLAFGAAAPGNASRRFDARDVYWRPPVHGRSPWLDHSDYDVAQRTKPFGDDVAQLMAQLPIYARAQLADLSPEVIRPRRITLARLGTAFGASFVANHAIPAGAPPVIADADPNNRARNIDDSARGDLDGFPLVKAREDLKRAQDIAGFKPWLDSLDAYLGDGVGGNTTGLALAQLYWGGESVVRVDDPREAPFIFKQIFTDPANGRAALHGHHVQAEGVQIRLCADRLRDTLDHEMAALEQDGARKRERQAQLVRYKFESDARSLGLNGYLAERGALLLASAASSPDRINALRRHLRLWSPAGVAQWFEAVRADLLHQHPLLTQARVADLGAAFSDEALKAALVEAVGALDDTNELRRHMRACLLQSAAISLRQSFVELGGGDERQVAIHVRLPIQFDGEGDEAITIAETVGLGDGTTRAYLSRLDDARSHWRDGYLSACENAAEDRALESLFAKPDRHQAWRALNQTDLDAMAAVTHEIGADPARGLPAVVRRVLFDVEAIGDEEVEVYDLAQAVRAVALALSARLGRSPTAWELASGAVDAARAGDGVLARMFAAYANIEDAQLQESFSPEARLSEQVYRVSAKLCVDGCQACLHQGSDLMGASLMQASVSRTLLHAFVCT